MRVTPGEFDFERRWVKRQKKGKRKEDREAGGIARFGSSALPVRFRGVDMRGYQKLDDLTFFE